MKTFATFEEFSEGLTEFYKQYQDGGPLHIVLEDGNVEPHHILWCLKHLNEWEDIDTGPVPPEYVDLAWKLSEYLLRSPVPYRELRDAERRLP